MNGFAELPVNVLSDGPLQCKILAAPLPTTLFRYCFVPIIIRPMLSALSLNLLGTFHKKMSMGQVFQVDIDACVSVGESDI